MPSTRSRTGPAEDASQHWGARTLDLDIVRYGSQRVVEPDLIIPHPELPNRDFWQRELAELESREFS